VRMARGSRGLPKVLPGPTVPYPSMPCGWATPKRCYGHFRGGLPADWVACGRLLPFWTPHAVRLWKLVCPGAYFMGRRLIHGSQISYGILRPRPSPPTLCAGRLTPCRSDDWLGFDRRQGKFLETRIQNLSCGQLTPSRRVGVMLVRAQRYLTKIGREHPMKLCLPMGNCFSPGYVVDWMSGDCT
jgi:hypothetical protein